MCVGAAGVEVCPCVEAAGVEVCACVEAAGVEVCACVCHCVPVILFFMTCPVYGAVAEGRSVH